jgi:hypothetical protein
MKDLNARTKTIRNQIEKITKEKKKTISHISRKSDSIDRI